MARPGVRVSGQRRMWVRPDRQPTLHSTSASATMPSRSHGRQVEPARFHRRGIRKSGSSPTASTDDPTGRKRRRSMRQPSGSRRRSSRYAPMTRKSAGRGDGPPPASQCRALTYARLRAWSPSTSTWTFVRTWAVPSKCPIIDGHAGDLVATSPRADPVVGGRIGREHVVGDAGGLAGVEEEAVVHEHISDLLSVEEVVASVTGPGIRRRRRGHGRG